MAQGNHPCDRINGGDLRGEAQLNIVIAVKLLGPQIEALQRHFPQKIGLRQRRALIGRIGFLADQSDRALISQGPQLNRERGSGLPRSDNNNSRHCARPLVSCFK